MIGILVFLKLNVLGYLGAFSLFQCSGENVVYIIFLNSAKGKNKTHNFAMEVNGHPVAFPLKDY